MNLRVLAGVVVLAGVATANASGLGAANGYSLFTFSDSNISNTDSWGRLAIGGNGTLSGYDVSNGDTGGNVLIGGGSLTMTNGTIHGNAVYGTTGSFTGTTFTNGGAPSQGSPIDFGAAKTQLQGESTFLAGLSATGSVSQPFSTLQLLGSNAGLNVFTLTAAQLAGASDIQISAPGGSTVLVNVTGSLVTLPNFGYNLTGIDSQHLLWNLGATSLNMSSIRGSVLAPFATVTSDFGSVDGQVVANVFNGHGEFHNFQFGGDVPAVPEPATMVALGLGVVGLVRKRRRR